MNWMQIALAAIIGAISGGASYYIVKAMKIDKKYVSVVAIVLFFGLKSVFSPIADGYFNEKQIEKSLSEIDFYKVIKEKNPEAYSYIKNELLKYAKNGMDADNAMKNAQSIIAGLITKELPNASSGQLTSYMKLNMRVAKEMCKKDTLTCYDFIFKPASGRTDYRNYVSHALFDSLINEAAIVVSTASPMNIVTDEIATSQNLNKVVSTLNEKYGEKLSLISGQAVKDEEKGLAMDIVFEFYDMIFQYNTDNASNILRSILKN